MLVPKTIRRPPEEPQRPTCHAVSRPNPSSSRGMRGRQTLVSQSLCKVFGEFTVGLKGHYCEWNIILWSWYLNVFFLLFSSCSLSILIPLSVPSLHCLDVIRGVPLHLPPRNVQRLQGDVPCRMFSNVLAEKVHWILLDFLGHPSINYPFKYVSQVNNLYFLYFSLSI